VEGLVSGKNKPPGQKRAQRKKDPNTIKLEKEISETLGARVDISHNKKGSGKLIINFKNLEQLQGILNKIK
jgi:ParB family chromosome partitioning protein